MTRFFDSVTTLFHPQLAEAVALWLPRLFAAAVTLLVFAIAIRLATKGVRFGMHRAKIDATATAFVTTLVRYALFTVGAVTVLGQLGIDVSGILASLGVAGLTIGFAARDALSNIISGIFIFWDRPFVIGDLVEIGEAYGEVSEITMRSTRVVTPDGKMLAIPNATIVNSTVVSYTNFPHLRLDIEFTIGVGEDVERVRRILCGLVEGDDRYLSQPAPTVVLTELGDYNNTVRFRPWLDNEKDHLVSRFELRERAYRALTAAGVDMPFETLALSPVDVRVAGQPAA